MLCCDTKSIGMDQRGPNAGPKKLHCPRCGQAMLVAPEHLHVSVACPHCQRPIDPSRMTSGTRPVSPQAPPRPPQMSPPRGAGTYSRRNRWVAGALGVLLGPFGVHRFYLGFTGIGILQVVLTVGSVFILTPVVGIWAFIEGILCFCGALDDVDGLPLRG